MNKRARRPRHSKKENGLPVIAWVRGGLGKRNAYQERRSLAVESLSCNLFPGHMLADHLVAFARTKLVLHLRVA
ncbi:hypothetical protein EMEDMD4_940013 [Sinorhizobium medicae]|uniref:Uncharacterized protein n=1 Tax=Sinorhizobium medicae TaxID=110321 RepID=A0A508XA05_9HYPH|nr:hypothetical protein EMEDMD4_940013 [Sinorhizobium medicae]